MAPQVPRATARKYPFYEGTARISYLVKYASNKTSELERNWKGLLANIPPSERVVTEKVFNTFIENYEKNISKSKFFTEVGELEAATSQLNQDCDSARDSFDSLIDVIGEKALGKIEKKIAKTAPGFFLSLGKGLAKINIKRKFEEHTDKVKEKNKISNERRYLESYSRTREQVDDGSKESLVAMQYLSKYLSDNVFISKEIQTSVSGAADIYQNRRISLLEKNKKREQAQSRELNKRIKRLDKDIQDVQKTKADDEEIRQVISAVSSILNTSIKNTNKRVDRHDENFKKFDKLEKEYEKISKRTEKHTEELLELNKQQKIKELQEKDKERKKFKEMCWRLKMEAWDTSFQLIGSLGELSGSRTVQKVASIGQHALKIAGSIHKFNNTAKEISKASSAISGISSMGNIAKTASMISCGGNIALAFIGIAAMMMNDAEEDAVHQALEAISEQLTVLRKEMHQRFDRVERGIDAIIKNQLTILSELQNATRALQLQLFNFEERLTYKIDKLFDHQRAMFDFLRAQQAEILLDPLQKIIVLSEKTKNSQQLTDYSHLLAAAAGRNGKACNRFFTGRAFLAYSNSQAFNEILPMINRETIPFLVGYLSNYPGEDRGLFKGFTFQGIDLTLLFNPDIWSKIVASYLGMCQRLPKQVNLLAYVNQLGKQGMNYLRFINAVSTSKELFQVLLSELQSNFNVINKITKKELTPIKGGEIDYLKPPKKAIASFNRTPKFSVSSQGIHRIAREPGGHYDHGYTLASDYNGIPGVISTFQSAARAAELKKELFEALSVPKQLLFLQQQGKCKFILTVSILYHMFEPQKNGNIEIDLSCDVCDAVYNLGKVSYSYRFSATKVTPELIWSNRQLVTTTPQALPEEAMTKVNHLIDEIFLNKRIEIKNQHIRDSVRKIASILETPEYQQSLSLAQRNFNLIKAYGYLAGAPAKVFRDLEKTFMALNDYRQAISFPFGVEILLNRFTKKEQFSQDTLRSLDRVLSRLVSLPLPKFSVTNSKALIGKITNYYPLNQIQISTLVGGLDTLSREIKGERPFLKTESPIKKKTIKIETNKGKKGSSLPPMSQFKTLATGDPRTHWYGVTQDAGVLLEHIRTTFLVEQNSSSSRETKGVVNSRFSQCNYENSKRVFLCEPFPILCSADPVDQEIHRWISLNFDVIVANWSQMPTLLIFPILKGVHWICVRIEIDYQTQKGSILWDDPYGPNHITPDLKNAVRKGFKPLLEKFIIKQCGSSLISGFKLVDYSKMISQQSNGYDCGPIIMSNVVDYCKTNLSNRDFSTNSALYTVTPHSRPKYEEEMIKLREMHRRIFTTMGDESSNHSTKKRKLPKIVKGLSEELVSVFYTILENHRLYSGVPFSKPYSEEEYKLAYEQVLLFKKNRGA